MLDYFLDKEDGRVGLSIDWYMPDWLCRLLWPDHRYDPEDAEVYISVHQQALRDMMELSIVRMLDYQFTDPLPGSGTTYTMQHYKDTLFDPAPPMDQE